MRLLLFMILLFVADAAYADDKAMTTPLPMYTLERQGSSVTLYREPCSGQTQSMLPLFMPAKYWPKFRNVHGVLDLPEWHFEIDGCWMDMPEEFNPKEPSVYVLFEDGTQWSIPKKLFNSGEKL